MDWYSTQESDNKRIVRRSRLPDRYKVEDTQAPDNTGRTTLTINEQANNDAKVHTKQVGLAYGAVFGPDASDVNAWKARAVQVVEQD